MEITSKNRKSSSASFIRSSAFQRVIIIAVVLLLYIFFYARSTSFRRYTTIVQICSNMYYTLLMAIGVTFPLITGGNDLSMGTGLICYSLIGSYMIRINGWPLWAAIMLTVGMGAHTVLAGELLIREVQRHMAHQMPPEVQEDLVARAQGTFFQAFRRHLFPVHPAGDRGGNLRILQNRLQRFRFCEQARVIAGLKIRDDGNQFHSMLAFVCNGRNGIISYSIIQENVQITMFIFNLFY